MTITLGVLAGLALGIVGSGWAYAFLQREFPTIAHQVRRVDAGIACLMAFFGPIWVYRAVSRHRVWITRLASTGAHPARDAIMTIRETRTLPCGLYRIYWTTGGRSLAAVGMTPSGGRWLAPINWVAPGGETHWRKVQRVVALRVQS